MERRDFVRYCSALIAMGLSPVAVRADEGIRVIRGDPDVDHTSASNVRVRSKKRHIVVAVKKNVFLVSPDSEVHFEHDESFLLSATRLIAGGIHSVFDPEETQPRAVSTPHVTAAIRGTGHYAEVQNELDRSYSCCCYGDIHLRSRHGHSEESQSTSYHDARVIGRDGQILEAPYDIPLNHYDDSLVYLESQAGREPHWDHPNPPGFQAPFVL